MLRRKIWLTTLLLLAVLLVACSSPQRARVDSGGRSVPSSVAQAVVAPSTAPAADLVRPDLLSSRDLYLAYRLILDAYVDRVDHTGLLEALFQAVREELVEAGALPLDTAPLDLAPSSTSDPDSDWLAFAAAYDAIVAKYHDWAVQDRVDHVALRRLMESLADAHTVFLTPDDVKRRTESNYSGIGVALTKPLQEMPPLVKEVFAGSPAAAAGLRAGDRITAVDGRSTASLPLSAIVDLIRGPEGTDVTLTLQREGAATSLEVRVRRGAVQVVPVEVGFIGPVGYLRVRQFNEAVPQLVGEALLAGAGRGVTAWIIDLRGNPGGSLEAVRRVAGFFLGERAIGYRLDRVRRRDAVNSVGRMLVQPEVPKVVLVDQETGSGAEILAAAMKEYRVARLVGTTTAGSVGVAQVVPLSDGSAVQITVQRFLSASGQRLERTGVAPDETVELTDADLAAGRDPQVQRALQILVG